MSDEMITMSVKQLKKELNDIFPRLINGRTWKDVQKAMREEDVYSIRKEKNELVDGTLRYLASLGSVAEAKEALETEDWDILYLIGERVISVTDHLSTVPDTDLLTVPQSGRERFLWLLLNRELSTKGEMSYYNW